MSKEERKKFADEIFSLGKSLDPVLFSVAIDKLAHYRKYITPEPPHKLSVRYIIPRFSKFVQRYNEIGLMIHDAEGLSDSALRKFVSDSRRSGIVLQGNPDFNPFAMFQTDNKLEGLMETILFTESHTSPVLQLVDFYAYATFAHYERNQSIRFNEFHDLFDHVGNNYYGIVKLPKD